MLQRAKPSSFRSRIRPANVTLHDKITLAKLHALPFHPRGLYAVALQNRNDIAPVAVGASERRSVGASERSIHSEVGWKSRVWNSGGALAGWRVLRGDPCAAFAIHSPEAGGYSPELGDYRDGIRDSAAWDCRVQRCNRQLHGCNRRVQPCNRQFQRCTRQLQACSRRFHAPESAITALCPAIASRESAIAGLYSAIASLGSAIPGRCPARTSVLFLK